MKYQIFILKQWDGLSSSRLQLSLTIMFIKFESVNEWQTGCLNKYLMFIFLSHYSCTLLCLSLVCPSVQSDPALSSADNRFCPSALSQWVPTSLPGYKTYTSHNAQRGEGIVRGVRLLHCHHGLEDGDHVFPDGQTEVQDDDIHLFRGCQTARDQGMWCGNSTITD